MNGPQDLRKSLLLKVAISGSLIAAAGLARADSTADTSVGRMLDPVLVTAQMLKGPQDAPSQGSLVATQPQSIVNKAYIHLNDSPAANYTDIIKFTPSVFTVDPNGPGLSENLGTSIRGFQDGQFNVTFDGIPWGDSNDFTHHSTSYFMPQDIGNVIVDRGPGNAATLGDATFGGTVYVETDNPHKDQGATAWASYGSFKTKLLGLRYDTGTVARWNGASAFISAKSLSSNGYLSNAKLDRNDVFLKIIQPINDFTNLSFVSNLNKVHQYTPFGATLAQIQAFGPSYGLNTNPNSQSYYQYNLDKITTDYEYLGAYSHFSGWTFDNKVYTYGYFHDGWNGEDPMGQAPDGSILPNGVPNGTVYGPNNVPGQQMHMYYRSVGDFFRVAKVIGPGEAQAGVWFDHQTNSRAQFEIDATNNNAYNPINGPGCSATSLTCAPTLANSVDRLMNDYLFTREYYGQYVWHAIDGLDLTGGVKHVSFERVLNATNNQGPVGGSLAYDQTWSRNLASFDAHYKIMANWSVYAQWAQGFLAPNLNVFYVADPSKNSVSPQSTTNVQVGTTWVGHRVTVSADFYKIDFNNEIASKGGGVNKYFYNLGGVKYHGVELEGSYNIGMGFTAYANASVNSAKLTSDQTWVPNTPDRTAGLGMLYRHMAWQGSLMAKYVGRRYGDSGNTLPFASYATLDGALSYDFGDALAGLTDLQVGVTAQNLADRHTIYADNGQTANGDYLLFAVPGRSYQVNITAKF